MHWVVRGKVASTTAAVALPLIYGWGHTINTWEKSWKRWNFESHVSRKHRRQGTPGPAVASPLLQADLRCTAA